MTPEDADQYLRIGITAVEVVRLRWPDVTDLDATSLLWEHTPYPLVRGLLDIAEYVALLPEDAVLEMAS